MADKNNKEIPIDWFEPNPYRGFGRIKSQFVYSVRLSVLGKQEEMIKCKHQLVAARAYDAALWRLLPFTPLFAKPNFPEEFEALTVELVETRCPFANRLYDEKSKQFSDQGIDVQALQKKRLLRLLVPEVKFEGESLSRYGALQVRVWKACAALQNVHARIEQARERLTHLQKLPELARTILEAENAAANAFTLCLKARSELASHKELYGKFSSL